MKNKSKRKTTPKTITAEEFDRMADAGEDISPYLDWDKAVVVRPKIKRVNVDFPEWMVEKLDEEAGRMNVSRQAVIKMWLRERLYPRPLLTRWPSGSPRPRRSRGEDASAR